MRLHRAHGHAPLDRYDRAISYYIERWRKPRRSWFIDLDRPSAAYACGAAVMIAGLVWFAVETLKNSLN